MSTSVAAQLRELALEVGDLAGQPLDEGRVPACRISQPSDDSRHVARLVGVVEVRPVRVAGIVEQRLVEGHVDGGTPVTYCCIRCEYDKARANAAPGRRHLQPLYSPAAVGRDASAGGATSSADRSSPVPAALDTHPRPATTGVSGLPEPEPAARAAVGEPRLRGCAR